MTFSKHADFINSSLDWLSQQHESCFVSSRERTGKLLMHHNGRHLSIISQYATKNLGICTVQRVEMQLNWRGCPIKIQFALWIRTINSEGCRVASWVALKCTRWPCKIWFNKSSRDWNSLGSVKTTVPSWVSNVPSEESCQTSAHNASCGSTKRGYKE